MQLCTARPAVVSSVFLALASLLLLPSVFCADIPPRTDLTAPWISVDEDGQPERTYTPTMTTVDGTPSAVDGAPHDLTASVYTFTTRGYEIESTGSPPPPAATAKSGAGAFPRCFNQTGLVCDPPEGSVLNPGKTYYITWDIDSDYFDDVTKNSTVEVSIRGDYLNATNGNITGKAFESTDAVPMSWGFYPWAVTRSVLSGDWSDGANLTLSLRLGRSGNRERTLLTSHARTVQVQNPPRFVPPAKKGADKTALLIALPLVLGLVLVCCITSFVCMRHHRQIALGNVMSRKRFGGKTSAARRARKQRLAKVDEADIPLNTDMDLHESLRDTEGDVQDQGQSKRNVFREEIRRQDTDRRA